MMNLRMTLAMVVIALALAGTYSFQQYQASQATPTPFRLPNAIFTDIRTNQVNRLEVRSGGQVGVVEKVDDSWRVGGPDVSLADGAKVESSISALVNLRSTRVLTGAAEVSTNLMQFGLAPPQLVIEASGPEIGPIQLSIGADALASSGRYALKSGSNDVYIIASSPVSDWLKLIVDPPRATATATRTPAPEATATPTP